MIFWGSLLFGMDYNIIKLKNIHVLNSIISKYNLMIEKMRQSIYLIKVLMFYIFQYLRQLLLHIYCIPCIYLTVT